MTPIVENLQKNREQIEGLCENFMDIIRQEITMGQ